MSKLETNTIDNISGSSTLNLGDTNATAITIDSGVGTLTIPNGITTGHMYPAFYAYRNSNQTITSGTSTKIQINTEVFDTNSYFDNSTNYRYTPLIAGKYFFFASARGDTGQSNLNNMAVQIKKNGSDDGTGGANGGGMIAQYTNVAPNRADNMSINVSGFFEMDGTDDYVELYVSISDSSGNPIVIGNSNQKYTTLGGYRIGA